MRAARQRGAIGSTPTLAGPSGGDDGCTDRSEAAASIPGGHARGPGHLAGRGRDRRPDRATGADSRGAGLLALLAERPRMPLHVETTDRFDIVDVTAEVRDAIPADFEDGLCTVFVRHTTAGVVVNEHEQRLLGDIESYLHDIVPREDGYAHDAIDDNADSHLRTLLLDESVSVPIRDGDLALGTWQSVLLIECDGPRTRSLSVTCTPSA